MTILEGGTRQRGGLDKGFYGIQNKFKILITNQNINRLRSMQLNIRVIYFVNKTCQKLLSVVQNSDLHLNSLINYSYLFIFYHIVVQAKFEKRK